MHSRTRGSLSPKCNSLSFSRGFQVTAFFSFSLQRFILSWFDSLLIKLQSFLMEDDTKLRKIFVGCLAWKTRKDTLIDYFKQFGEIVEANVVIDKGTGKSRGYGFVTFKTAESATRALQDMNPEIDGRRTDCRLAYIGSRNPFLRHGFAILTREGMWSSPLFHQQYTGQFARPCSAYRFCGYSPYPMARTGTGTGVFLSQYNATQSRNLAKAIASRAHTQAQVQGQARAHQGFGFQYSSPLFQTLLSTTHSLPLTWALPYSYLSSSASSSSTSASAATTTGTNTVSSSTTTTMNTTPDEASNNEE